VIGDRPLEAYAPLERAAKGIVVTQYDMYSVEEVGLVKIDLLGNRCLTEIQETLERVRSRREGSGPPADPGAPEERSAAADSPAGPVADRRARPPIAGGSGPLPGAADRISPAAPAGYRPGGTGGIASPLPAPPAGPQPPGEAFPQPGTGDGRPATAGRPGGPRRPTPSLPLEPRPDPSADPVLRLADIPDGDRATAALLREGRTVGCFQIESPGMRSLLRQLAVSDVRECIVAVALIRPGPAEGGMKERYIRRAAGEEPVEYSCPSLRDVLEENLGIILYEEDVMRVAAAVTGMSLAEGDLLRSRLKKLASPEEARDAENDFLRRAIAAGTAPDAAREVWKDLCRFSRYTFNKAHAAGYGLLAYQAAYLKAHHPVEYACALLNNHAGMYGVRTIAEEARRMGVPLLAPCVNRSGRRHEVEDLETGTADGESAGLPGATGPARPRGVRLALSLVKGLSEEAREHILRGRPFRSLGDLLRRTRIPRREIEALVLAGGLDFTGLNRPQLLWELESTHGRECGRGGLGLAGEGGEEWSVPPHPPLRDYPLLVKVRREIDVLDLSVTAHPLAVLRDRAARRGCIPIADALGRTGQKVRVAGLTAAWRPTPTRTGGRMLFLTLEDETGLLEATLFSRAAARHGRALSSLGPHIAEGTIEERRRSISLIVEHLESLET